MPLEYIISSVQSLCEKRTILTDMTNYGLNAERPLKCMLLTAHDDKQLKKIYQQETESISNRQ